jgi:hypothetical protein
MTRAAFYKGTRPGLPGLYNRAVRWWECGPYSHCELVFSDGRAASASFMDHGVRFKEIDFDPERWDFIDLPGANEALAELWFLTHLGCQYDLLGNVHFLLGPVRDDRRKYFCSEALAAALGMPEAWRYGPNALAAVLRTFNQPALAYS